MPRYESNFNGTIILDATAISPPEQANRSYIRPDSRDALVDHLKGLRDRKETPERIVVVGGFSSFEFPQLHLAEEGDDLSTSRRELPSPRLLVDVSGMNRIIDVDNVSLTVTVEAGITYWDLSGRQGTDSNVWAVNMSDVGLEAILTLGQLRELRFGCSSLGVGSEGTRFATVSAMSVTPRRLEKMKGLGQLQKLRLEGCDRIDDEAVAILATFPKLEEVDLKGTAVTEKGLAALRAARPKLRVMYGAWEAKSANFRNN